MKKEVISKCPVCSNDLTITKLHCDSCHIEITGEFTLSKFNYLTKEQLNFVELFLKTQGNIKALEKEMGVSYPTVKRMLNDVLISLGYENISDDEKEEKKSNSRIEILDRLANKEIVFEEAMEELKKIK